MKFKGYSKSSGYKASKKDVEERYPKGHKNEGLLIKDKHTGTVNTWSGGSTKKSVAKKMKTYHGRPIEELKREAGIGKYKERYN